ncbi:MAG: Omp28-related outer membrane protein [Ignavibacteria bacterium]|nr:Omp28-related outer membrane protein [Ignavibacteria bacterium]
MRILFFVGYIVFIVLLNSCDIIKPPYIENNTIDDTTKYSQKILLEEFTGFRCGNCPEAIEIAHSLRKKYPNNLILLSVHSGSYARPTSTRTYDFRTVIGDELDLFFGCSKAGNPNGMVNRFGYPNKTHILREGQWEPVIKQLLKQKPKIHLGLSVAYNNLTKEIFANVTVKYLEDSSPNYHLCVYLAEDSIVQYQRDDRKVPPDIEDFVHDNVLRDGITSTWGVQLSANNVVKGTTIQREFTYKIPSDKNWRPEKLKVIAFVHDKDNSFQIIQVDEKKLIE